MVGHESKTTHRHPTEPDGILLQEMGQLGALSGRRNQTQKCRGASTQRPTQAETQGCVWVWFRALPTHWLDRSQKRRRRQGRGACMGVHVEVNLWWWWC